MKLTILLALLIASGGCQIQVQRQTAGPTLDSAAASLTALQIQYEMCACNIANAHTIGYKASHAVLQDVPYTDRVLTNADGSMTNVRVGSGIRVVRTVTDMSQGPAMQTSGILDIMIDGSGFLIVRGAGSGLLYTRAGLLSLNSDRELVTASGPESRIEPPITIPGDASQIKISSTGVVSVLRAGSAEPEEVGQIQIASFPNPSGLRLISGEIFTETPESGAPLQGDAGTGGRGVIYQGMLEGSNVISVSEQIEAARVERQYQAISRLAFPPADGRIAAIPR